MPQASADGPYGKSAELHNVVSNPISDINNYTAPGIHGGDAGLELFVRSGTPSGGDVPIAELSTARMDMMYGSYRVAMKMTAVAGTCSAFFWVLFLPPFSLFSLMQNSTSTTPPRSTSSSSPPRQTQQTPTLYWATTLTWSYNRPPRPNSTTPPQHPPTHGWPSHSTPPPLSTSTASTGPLHP